MAANFNVKFLVNRTSGTYQIQLTDTSSGFTLDKANFKITYPNGIVVENTDFTSPDISSAGGTTNKDIKFNVNNKVLTGTYTIVINAKDSSNNDYTATKAFNFVWTEPVPDIINTSDVLAPQVKFKDNTSGYDVGNFSETITTRTLSSSFPSTSDASGASAISSDNTSNFGSLEIDMVNSGNYYEGDYTPSLSIDITYEHTADTYLSVQYIKTYSETIAVKRAPTQNELLTKINQYKDDIDTYKNSNPAVFARLSEQYDLVIGLYSHIIDRTNASLTSGSEASLRELLDIVEPNASHTFQSGTINQFTTTDTESTQDIIGGMVSSNTESGIDVTYNDTTGKINFDVADFTITQTGDTTGTVTVTNLANATLNSTLATVNSTTGAFGSTTAIPVITVNGKGLITNVTTAAISTVLTLAADSGSNDNVTIGTDTLTIAGGTGLTTTISNNNISVAIDSTVATLTGSQTLTNKTLSSPLFSGNILSDVNIGESNNLKTLTVVGDVVVGDGSTNMKFMGSGTASNIQSETNDTSIQILTKTNGSHSISFKVSPSATSIYTDELYFDSVTLDGIQTSSESFADNDTSLMTSAAIDDRINSAVATKDNTDEITEGSTNLYYTEERVDDRVNALLQAGSNVSLSYDDAANTLTISSTQLTNEQVQDVIGGMLDGDETGGISVTYDDTNNEIDFALSSIPNSSLTNSSITVNGTAISLGGSGTLDTDDVGEGSTNQYFTNERVDDRVNALLQEGSNVSLTYDDTANTLTIAATQLTSEEVQDIIGGMLGGDETGGISVAYDDTNNEIDFTISNVPNSSLTNSSITINGTSVSLGGTITLDTDDISEGITNQYFTNARARGAISENSTQLSYDSSTGVLTFTQGNTDTVSEGTGNLYFTNERVDDRVSSLIQNGTGISWSYDDIANTFTPTISLSSFDTGDLSEGTNLYYTAARFNTAFAGKSTSDLSEGTNLYYTDERVDDRVSNLLTAGSNISLTYDDTAGTLTIASTQLTSEQVEDIVGAMVNGGTETFITVSYDDTNGKLNFVVPVLNETNLVSNSATSLATQQSIKTYVDDKVAGLVDSAPSALDTLNELAAALGDDANFSTTTSTALGNRLRVDVNTQGLNATQQGNALTNLGITATLTELNYVDGVTSSIQTQLDSKLSSESDTLDSVTGRGATTTNAITTGDITISSATPELLFADTDNNTDAKLLANNGNVGIFSDINQEYSDSIIYFNIDGTERARFDGSGYHFRPGADSTYDLGLNTTRWRNVYADNYYGDGSNLTGVAADESRTIILTVKNKSGGSLSKGTLVHASPSATPPSGNVIEVVAAENDVEASMPALGVLNETLANEAEGECVVLGSISGISTTNDGTSTGTLFSIGDFLYVSDTAGLFTNVKPTGTKLIQKIGIVIKAHATNGTVEVFGAGRTNDVPTPLYIDHANQRVGIGDTSPGYPLDTSGTIRSTSVSTSPGAGAGVELRYNSAAGSVLAYDRSSSSYLPIRIEGSTIDLREGGSSVLFVDDGKVGIGLTNPDEKLHVDGTSRFNGDMHFGTSTGGLIYKPLESSAHAERYFVMFDYTNNASYPFLTNRTPNGAVVIKTGTAAGGGENEHFRIKGGDGTVDAYFTNTNLGIGTTTPDTRLHVVNDSSNNQLTLQRTGTATGKYEIYTNTNSLFFYDRAQSALRAMIDSSGNFLVNKTTAGAASVGVEARAVGQLLATRDGDNVGYFNRKTSDGDVIQIRKDNSTVGVIGTQNWGIGTSNPTFAGGSGLEIEKAGIATLRLQDTTNVANVELQSGESGLHIRVGANGSSGDLFNVSSAGTSRLLIDSSGDVGIGTTSPENLLHIKAADGVTGVLKIEGGKNTSTSVGEINSQIDFGSNDGSVWSTGNVGGRIASVTETTNGALTGMAFYTFRQGVSSPDSLSEKVRITNDGKVGIGTTSPADKLEVLGNIRLRQSSSNNETVYISTNSRGGGTNDADLRLGNSVNGDILTVHNTNVGIGDTSPSAKLDVNAGTSDTIAIFESTDSRGRIQIGDDDTNVYVIAENTKMSLGTSNTLSSTNLTIDSSGNVGIGETSPSAKLHIKTSNVSNTNQFLLESTDAGASSAPDLALYRNSASPADDDVLGALWFYGNNDASAQELYSGIISVASDVSDTTEDSEIRFLNMVNGTLDTRMTIDGTSVGIGTTSPTRNLTVSDTTSSAINIKSNTTNGLSFLALGDADDDNYAQILLDNSTNKLQIQNGGGAGITDRGITLDSSENVGIGTSSPSYKTHIQGTSSVLLSLDARDTTTGAVDTGAEMLLTGHDGVNARDFVKLKGAKENGTSGNYAGYFAVQTRPNGGSLTERMRIASNGEITFNAYGAGHLKTDANGVISVDTSVVDGSGTANDVVMWSDSNTLTDAPIAISGNDASFTGIIKSSNNSSYNFLDFDDDSTTHNPDTNVTTLASVSGIALATNLNDGGGGNFTVSTGSTSPTELLKITTSGDATFAGDVIAANRLLRIRNTTNDATGINSVVNSLYFDATDNNDNNRSTGLIQTTSESAFNSSVLSTIDSSMQFFVSEDNFLVKWLDVASDKTAAFAGDVSIPVAKQLFFGGGSHTYISEDVDDRLRFFVGGAEFMRFTEDTTDTINFYTDTTFTGDVTADSFIKDGGTSSQFLKADGSVDSNTYLTTSSASSTYVPKSGGSTLSGGVYNINTNTNTNTLNISRGGSNSIQVMKIGVQDTIATFNYIEDTTNEGNGNFGQYRFILGGNDGETSVNALILGKSNAIFAGTVKGTTYLVNHTSAAGIGASLGDINSAELGPGYLSLSRDDTADAKQIVFEKNDAEHSYIQTEDSNLRIVAGSSKHLYIDTNNNVSGMWRFLSSGIFQWGVGKGTLTWDSTYAKVNASGTGMELHLGSGDDTDAVKIIGSNTTFAGDVTVGGGLIVNGTQTILNTQTLSVDDKNIQLGDVQDTTGVTATLATETAVVTVSSTNGFAPGATLTKTAGTGAFGTNAVISSIDSATQFTASVNHATAGSITFTVGGATDATADGGGITLYATSSKTILWSSSTDTWDFNTGATFAGTVTVGTGTVAAANAAADDFVITGPGTTATGMTISNSSDAGTGTIFFGDTTSSSVAGFRYNHNTGDMAISAEDNITFTCDNVGIGETDPFGKLNVTRAGINEGAISFDDQANNAHLVLAGSDALVRMQLGTYNNGSYGAWIQASYDNGGTNYGTEPLILNPQGGNVGIGTTSPATKFHVTDGGTLPTISGTYLISATSASNAGIQINAGNTSSSILAFGDTDSQDRGLVLYDHSDNHMRFHTNGLERMRIASNGTVTLNAYGAGYLKTDANGVISVDTSTIEDTLQSVTDRGASTDNAITISTSTNRTLTLDYTGGTGNYTLMSFKQTDTNGTTEQFRLWGSYTDNYLSFYNDQSNLHQLKLNSDGTTTFGDAIETTKLGIGVAPSNVYGINQDFNSTDANIDNKFAYFIDADFSGSDNTTGDREQGGIKIDVDSSADGDSSNEHRLYGIWVDQRTTGFSDLSRAGYFYNESNNETANETPAEVTGVYGIAVADSTETTAGMNNLYGVQGITSIQDNGYVGNSYGGFFKNIINTNRAADLGLIVAGVRGEVEIDSTNSISITQVRAVDAVIDTDSGTPTITNGYLFKGSYEGTPNVTNKYGLYITGSAENYVDGDTTFTGVLELPGGTAANPSIGSTGDTNTGMYWPGDHQLGFAVNSSRKFYMSETRAFFQNLSSGVQIDSSSDAPLEVKSSDGTTGIKFTDNSANAKLYYVGSGNYFYTDAHRLGIGDVTAPSVALHVVGTDNVSSRFIFTKDLSTDKILFGGADHDDFDTFIGSSSNHSFTITQNGAKAITIDTSKNATFEGDITVTGTDIRTGASNGLNLGDDSSVVTIGATNELWTQNDTDADATLYINYRGYNAGNTRFRSLDIRDGKNGQIAYFDGTDKSTTFAGDVTADTIRATSTGDASVSSTTHAFQAGLTSSANVIIDNNEIMARNNGAVSGLHINPDGGGITISNNTSGASSIDAGGNANFAGTLTVGGNTNIYTGAGSAEFNIGRNSSERLQIYQDDLNTTLTADNDSDTNGTHNFILNRTFEGTGANNFVVQKDGTAQLTIDTNADATFAGNITSGDSSTATTIRAHHDDGAYVDHTGYGIQFARNASYLRPNNDGARTMYFGQSSLTWNAIVFDSNSYSFQRNGNTLLDIDAGGQVNFHGYLGGDGFTLPAVTENSGYSNIAIGGLGFLYREARDSYITQNTYYSKVSGANGWRAKYGGHGGTVITIDHGFTVSTAAAVTNSGDTFNMGTVFDIDSAGFGQFEDGLAVDGGDLVLGKDAYSISASYVGMKTSNMGGSSDYMIISGVSDGNTYVSSKSGSSTRIRGGGNSDAHELIIDANQAQFAGDVAFDYGHIGAGSGSYMMPIGFNRNTASGAIFNSSYSAYQLHNYQGDLKLQVYNSAGTYQGQHSFDSDLSTTFAGNVTIDNGTSSTLWVKCDNAGNAIVRASGEGQGTGVLEVGQSTSYGGGISYNGDASPAFVSGETADRITFYRMEAGTRTEVFSYPYSNNNVTFNGEIHLVDSNTKILEGAGNAVKIQTNSGNIEIGPQNTSYAHIATNLSRFYFNKYLVVDTGIIQSYDEDLSLRRVNSTDRIDILDTEIRFYLQGNEEMRLESDGDLHVDGDVIAYSTTVSDKALKDNVLTLKNSLDKVSKLRGVEYTWNATSRKGQKDIGVIAQEVEEVIPEIVREKKMSLVDGEKYKTVDYEKLTAVLIEANKELLERVEKLEEKLRDK